jgi:hypothetical protein
MIACGAAIVILMGSICSKRPNLITAFSAAVVADALRAGALGGLSNDGLRSISFNFGPASAVSPALG